MSKKPPRRPAHKQQPSTDTGDKYYQAGMQCAEKEDYVGVIQNMTRAIQLSPELGRAYYQRGLARYLLGDVEGAVTDLANSVDLNSAAIASLMEMGEMAGEEMMIRMAGPLLEEIFEACFEASLIFLEMDEHKLALAALNQAAGIFEDEPDVYMQRGLAYKGLKNYAKASADFNRTLRLQPDNRMALFQRAVTYREMGQFDKALVDFAELEKVAGDISPVYVERGMVYAAQGQWAQALADFQKGVELDEENFGLPALMTSMTLAQMGQAQEATQQWNVFSVLNEMFAPPHTEEALREIGKIYPPMTGAAEKLIVVLASEPSSPDNTEG